MAPLEGPLVEGVDHPRVRQRVGQVERGVVAARRTRLEAHEARLRMRDRLGQQLGQRQARPGRVEAGPTGDAVDVGRTPLRAGGHQLGQ